ncbi:MAG: hypothetical protein KKD53_07565, partial [Proteobacteria bacterium]|nr:hypothetical protein [Pseudomonadota bacterium]
MKNIQRWTEEYSSIHSCHIIVSDFLFTIVNCVGTEGERENKEGNLGKKKPFLLRGRVYYKNESA